jgi:hypothetical protein
VNYSLRLHSENNYANASQYYVTLHCVSCYNYAQNVVTLHSLYTSLHPTYNKRRNANWIGHILRRNCLLKHVIERKIGGGIDVTGRQRRCGTQLLNDLTKRKRCCQLKAEALYRSVWRGCGPVVRQTAEWLSIRYDIRIIGVAFQIVISSVQFSHLNPSITPGNGQLNDILQYGAHWNQLTRILKDFSHAFYVITNVLLVFFLYGTLKMITRVTKTCGCNK